VGEDCPVGHGVYRPVRSVSAADSRTDRRCAGEADLLLDVVVDPPDFDPVLVWPRLKRLGLTLDTTLGECRRLAFVHPGFSFLEASGELRPLDEWPVEHRDFVLAALSLKRQSLKDVVEYAARTRVWRARPAADERHGQQRDDRAGRAPDRRRDRSVS